MKTFDGSKWTGSLQEKDLNTTIMSQVVGEAKNSASSLFSAIKSTAGKAASSNNLYIPAGTFSGIQGNSTEIIDSNGLSSKSITLVLGGGGTSIHQTWVTIPSGWVQADIYFMWLHTESSLQTGGVTFRCSTALPQTGQAWGSSISTVNTTVNISDLQSYVLQESKIRANCPVSNDQPLHLHVGRAGTAADDTLESSAKLLGVKLVRIL